MSWRQLDGDLARHGFVGVIAQGLQCSPLERVPFVRDPVDYRKFERQHLALGHAVLGRGRVRVFKHAALIGDMQQVRIH